MIPITKITRDFKENDLQNLISRPVLEDKTAMNLVRKIVEDVRQNGDAALLKYTYKFDGANLSKEAMTVGQGEIKEAYAAVSQDFLEAIKLARKNISAFHRKQQLKSWSIAKDGLVLGQIVRPISRVGLYVPGGQAAYPSTVLMSAIPPQRAGVAEIAMCVPPDKSGKISPYTLVAAAEVGIKEIYKVGGAQAIAALAYGTETIRRVDKICGPGNIYVTLAKKLVLGDVGIDMLAGPSEVVVLADENAHSAFIAADLLAQAEHDPKASAILVTNSNFTAQAVKKQLFQQVSKLKRRKMIEASLANQGRIFLVDSFGTAIKLINVIAPEHLEIAVKNPSRLLDKIKNAGAIFLGSYSPEAVGDYVAGPNHILPTSGTARFSSPLSTDDFVKKSSLISYTQDGLKRIARSAATIAEAEGLDAHARSVLIRVEE